MKLIRLGWMGGVLVSTLAMAGAEGLRLKVAAGEHDRKQTMVEVTDPGTLPERPALEDSAGNRLPIQRSDDGSFAFMLPELAAGQSAEYSVVLLDDEPPDEALAEVDDGRVTLTVAGRPVASYRGGKGELPRQGIAEKFRRGGYLHPLLTPLGRPVTDDYPANHLHHHGVWMAWTKTEFEGRRPDFWNMGDQTGTVEAVAIDHHWNGPVHAGLDVQHRHVDRTTAEPVPVLDELWSVRVFALKDAAFHLLELRSEQRMANESELKLPEYHYGGLGVRGHGSWDGKRNARFLTSEGVADRDQANLKPVRWIHMAGGSEGQTAGIAILSHPENYRAPQPVRVHPDEPFISFAPQIGGPMVIQHATAYISRYRLVISDGPPDVALLEQLWNDYAQPPIATWVD